jgi:hypothetical protein
MDVMLMILIGIPAVAIVWALVVQLRREARDRRLDSHFDPADDAAHLDGNIEGRAAARAAFMGRGGGYPL